MNNWIYALIILGIYLIFALIHKISKNKKPFQRAFLSILIGPAIMLALNFIGGYFGVSLPLSIMSVFISMGGGIAGVTLMLVLNLFF